MSESETSSPSQALRPSEEWITFAHDLQLPDPTGWVGEVPQMPLSAVLDYCEELLAQHSPEFILSQPDRVKSSAEFIL
jgi:hypothetical protein